jgi:hypothetical protein
MVQLQGASIDAQLVSMDSARVVSFRDVLSPAEAGLPTTGVRALSFDQFVRWGHPFEPRPQVLVVLVDGSRIVTAAAWEGGTPVRLDGDRVTVLTDLWGEVPLWRELVRGVLFAQREDPRERERLEAIVGNAGSRIGVVGDVHVADAAPNGGRDLRTLP